MATVQTSSREEQLLLSIKNALEEDNYSPISQNLCMQKGNTRSVHSLRELLVTSSVKMEATTDTSVTALTNSDPDPREWVQLFEELHSFVEAGGTLKAEISLVLFPVFIHIYLYLVSGNHFSVAKEFYGKYSAVMSPLHPTDVKELSEVTAAEHLTTSPLVTKFRKQKYCLRMSNHAFHLLMQFLQTLSTPNLLTLIQRYLVIEVYGHGPPAPSTEAKGDSKSASVPVTFIKRKVPPVYENPEDKRNRMAKLSAAFSRSQATIPVTQSPSLPQAAGMGDGGSWMDSGGGGSGIGLTRTPTPGANPQQPSHITEFKDRLLQTLQFGPSSPSVALYTVENNCCVAHCSALGAGHIAAGLDNSSIHIWPLGVSDRMTTRASAHSTSSLPSAEDASKHFTLYGHTGPVYGMSFSASGQYLVSGSEDCSIRQWDVCKGACVVCYKGHAYPVWDIAFSPVDVYFASASYDRTARLWSTDLVYPLRIFAGHTAGVDTVAFHPNGNYLATGSTDHTCRLWDVQSGHCMRLMEGGKSAVNCLSFSPNGKFLASGGNDGVVCLWDLGSGSLVKEIRGHTSGITALAYSPDSTMLASSCHGNLIRVCSTRTLASSPSTPDVELICSHSTSDTVVTSLHFTHRNRLVAIGATQHF